MPAYAVAHLRAVFMGPAIVEYLERIDATLAPFGGRFLIHGGGIEGLEGTFEGTLVVIAFPDRETMERIVDVHFPDIQKLLVSRALDIFYQVREVPGLKKKPSTSELIDWLKLLLHEDLPLDVLQNRDPTKAIPPLHGALLKNEQDVMLFERLAFMARRNA